MSDIALKIIAGEFDIALKDGDLETDEGLDTAVLISLFTDRRVSDEELPLGQTNKRGWWGDHYSEVDGDQIGSRLWTLTREKRTNETLRRAEDFAREALQWLIDDGVSTSISAVAIYTNGTTNAWELKVSIERPSGRTSRFQIFWDKQILKRIE